MFIASSVIALFPPKGKGLFHYQNGDIPTISSHSAVLSVFRFDPGWSLRKDNPLAADFIAVVNTGYKKGGSRTIQEPDKKHGWKVVRKSTHAPAVFAGNNPDLPADTRQRCIPVFLYPSDEVEESDWEMIEEDDAEFLDLRHDLPIWAETAASAIKLRPTLPESVKGRYREV